MAKKLNAARRAKNLSRAWASQRLKQYNAAVGHEAIKNEHGNSLPRVCGSAGLRTLFTAFRRPKSPLYGGVELSEYFWYIFM